MVDGVDRLPELIERFANEIAQEIGMAASLISLLQAVPSYYLRYYYSTDEVLREQLSGTKKSRAAEVMEIERGLIEMYRDPKLTEKPKLLEKRGGAYYSEAAAQLIASLQADTGDKQIVDVRNNGALPELPDDAVVEIPARVGAKGAEADELTALQPEMLGLVQQVKAYERLTVKAAVDGDRTAALKALMANPLVARYNVARPLLDALLEANRSHLPRFFPDC
jgi:6-phospho-beta-glucosidase